MRLSVGQRARSNPSPHLFESLRLGKSRAPTNQAYERQDLDNGLFGQRLAFLTLLLGIVYYS